MTSPARENSVALDGVAGQEPARELVPAVPGVPAPSLPRRPVQGAARAATWVPADPETLRRVREALDRL